jgi:hypothetical protein
MWFLVRVAFWLSIVILLLPAAPAPQTAAEPKFNATQALAAAMAAISDMREFCARLANGYRQKVGGEKIHRSTQKCSQDTLTVLDRAEPWAGPLPFARSGTAKALQGSVSPLQRCCDEDSR